MKIGRIFLFLLYLTAFNAFAAGTPTTVLHGSLTGNSTYSPVVLTTDVSGLLPLSNMASVATNTLLGNATAGTASPTALAIPSCSAGGSALTWTTNTGFGCAAVTGTPGGSSGQIQYNNAGALGGLNSSGTGNVARVTSPVFVTPTLGAASATSVAGNSGTIAFESGVIRVSGRPLFSNVRYETLSGSFVTGLETACCGIPGIQIQNQTITAVDNSNEPGTYSLTLDTASGSTNKLVLNDTGITITGSLFVATRAVIPPFSATSASIGGGALGAGACASTATTVTGATSSMVAVVSPNTYPGDGNTFYGYISAANTVTVKVCAIIAGTPTASTYNIRVIP